MGCSKEQLIQRLQELQIDFAQYDHPVVMTVEAQEKYVGHMKGGLSKNLFLKDKKDRYYVVTALKDTNTDLKVLSRRLGLGKGVLRMAPEEAIGEILQVPLGSVTPFALVNESARHVSLLLDQGFKSQECCFFHPLSNDVTISLKAQDLDKFLKSIGRDPIYVDFEANPAVGKDQPPDLAAFVPSEAMVLPEHLKKRDSSQPSENESTSVNSKSTVPAKASKPAINKKKEKSTNTLNNSRFSADPEKFIEEILEKTSAIVLSEIKADAIEQNGEQLGAIVSKSIRKHLASDLKSLATLFKNTAYTEGFVAAKQSQSRHK